MKTATQSKEVFEALTVAFSLLLGKELGFEHPYGWLSVFEKDDLQDFIQELSEAFRLIDSSTTAWEMIDAIIHEWHESAVAIGHEPGKVAIVVFPLPPLVFSTAITLGI